jgi:MHS family proline/betaine transporter-like MFS transporter
LSGIWSSVVASLFPTRVRFSGVALSYNIAVTILSGFAPLAATFLIQHTGMLAAPGFYVSACAVLTFVASFFVARRLAVAPAAAEGGVRSAFSETSPVSVALGGKLFNS